MGWLIPLFFQVINLSGYSFSCMRDLCKRSTRKKLQLDELSILCESGVRFSSSPKVSQSGFWVTPR